MRDDQNDRPEGGVEVHICLNQLKNILAYDANDKHFHGED